MCKNQVCLSKKELFCILTGGGNAIYYKSWGCNAFLVLPLSMRVVFMQVFNTAGPHMGKWTQGCASRLADVLGAAFVLLNRADVCPGHRWRDHARSACVWLPHQETLLLTAAGRLEWAEDIPGAAGERLCSEVIGPPEPLPASELVFTSAR